MGRKNQMFFINMFGDKEYKNSKGEYHKLDGPAIESSNRNKYWYKEGKRHRIDGPADEYTNGDKYWWVLNQYLEEKEFNSWIIRILKFV